MTGPAGLAGEAAEAVRGLNHATLPGAGGLVFPADAYDVTGQLALLALAAAAGPGPDPGVPARRDGRGRVAVVAGDQAGDPGAVLTAVTASLDSAVASARRLHQALDMAQNHLTWAAAPSE